MYLLLRACPLSSFELCAPVYQPSQPNCFAQVHVSPLSFVGLSLLKLLFLHRWSTGSAGVWTTSTPQPPTLNSNVNWCAQVVDWFCGGLDYEYTPGIHGSQPEWLADLISTSFDKPLKTFKRSMQTRKVLPLSLAQGLHHISGCLCTMFDSAQDVFKPAVRKP